MGRLSRRLLRKQRPPKTAATQMRHQEKLRNLSVVYHKTKNPFEVKFCKHVSF